MWAVHCPNTRNFQGSQQAVADNSVFYSRYRYFLGSGGFFRNKLHTYGIIFCEIGILPYASFPGSQQAVADNSVFYSRHRYFLGIDGFLRNTAIYKTINYFAQNGCIPFVSGTNFHTYRISLEGRDHFAFRVHNKQSLTIVCFTRATGTFWALTEFQVNKLHRD